MLVFALAILSRRIFSSLAQGCAPLPPFSREHSSAGPRRYWPRVRTQAQRQYSLIWAPVVSATVGGAKTVENNVEYFIGGVAIPQSDEEDISAPFLPV